MNESKWNLSAGEPTPVITEQKIKEHLVSKYGLPDNFNTALYAGNFKVSSVYSLDDFVSYIFSYINKGDNLRMPAEVQFSNPKKFNHTEIENDFLTYNLPKRILYTVAETIKNNQTHSKTQSTGDTAIVNDNTLMTENELKDRVKTKNQEQTTQEQEVIQRLLLDKKFVHIIAHTEGGSYIQKVFSGEKEESVDEWRQKENLHHLRTTLGPEVTIFLINKSENLFKAIPVIKNFINGQGYGLVTPIDHGDRDGALAYWVIIPEDENEMKTFIEEHPETLLKIFKDNFYQKLSGSKWFSLIGNQKDELTLAQKEFVNTP